MSVTMDQMTAHIEASDARTDSKFEAALRHNDVQFEKMMRHMDNMQSEMLIYLARQRVWFLIMGVSIVISTLTILEFFGTAGPRHAPVIVNLPQAIEQPLADN